MSDTPAADPGSSSRRLELARLTAEVVDGASGVRLTAGPARRWSTGRIPDSVGGVVVVAQSPEVYEIAVHLVVAWPSEPLTRLSERLRRQVRAAGERAGHGERMGRIEVAIEDILDPGETLAVGGREHS